MEKVRLVSVDIWLSAVRFYSEVKLVFIFSYWKRLAIARLLLIKRAMSLIFLHRDLFDLSKDNIQIKESKSQGILLSGVTEVRALIMFKLLFAIPKYFNYQLFQLQHLLLV